jgi:2-oxoglutarate ferredoxin oxidoreductase subunit alpha
VLLSDQQLGQSYAVVDRVTDARAPAASPAKPASSASAASSAKRRVISDDPAARRYAITPSGVSPMVLPGTDFGHWVAEGLVHGESGMPSTAPNDHLAQLDKRARKLLQHDYGAHWAQCIGDGDLAVFTWGSATGATFDAVGRMHADSANLRGVALRLLAPLPTERLTAMLRGVRAVLVVEQNHSAQLYRLLRAFGEFAFSLTNYARPGPLPLRPGEIEQAIIRWRHAQ